MIKNKKKILEKIKIYDKNHYFAIFTFSYKK